MQVYATQTVTPEETVAPEEDFGETADPSGTPTPDATPAASEMPAASETPTPDATPAASETSVPDETPSPSATPSPGEIPEEDYPEFVNSYIDIDITVGTPNRPVLLDDWSYAASLPSSYDAREKGMVSSVKNQNPFGTCWAFSAVALAESAYMRLYGEEPDLSESHLVEFFYNGEDEELTTDTGNITGDYVAAKSASQEQQGGNSIYTTFALASWKGIADESVDTSLQYSTATSKGVIEIPVEYAFTDKLHLENAYFIPTTDTEGMKKAIMEYGGISVSYYYDRSYDSSWSDGEAYFYPNSSGTNHAVTIVGWDDNYSVDSFETTVAYKNGISTTLPTSDGAWLVKNSWGTGYHDGGYFWMSYEEASLSDVAYVFDFDSADNYDHNYQYDGGCLYGYTSFPKAAAVYQASGNQEIKAVGTAFSEVDTAYTVKIYTDLTDPDDPESGELMATQSGVSNYEGFYTIALDDSVYVGKDTYFSVVLEGTDGGSLSLMYDGTYQGSGSIDFVAVCNEGETFAYSSWNGWRDAKNYFSNMEITLRIKAYTDDAEKITDATELTGNMISEIPDQEYTGEAIEPAVEVKDGAIVLEEGTDYTVSYAENINVGEATVTVQGLRQYTGSATKKFKITPRTLSDDMLSASDKEYDGQAYDKAEVSVETGKLGSEDYVLTYYVNQMPRGEALDEAPVDAGNYVAVVTGKGNYKGSAEAAFTIKKASIDEAQILLQYSDNHDLLGISVLLAEKELAAEDYTVDFYDESGETILPRIPTEMGSYIVKVSGTGNYEGQVSRTFSIAPKKLSAMMFEVTDGIYDGTQYQAVKAKEGLVKEGNYIIRYNKTPINAGAYTATVEGTGEYEGTIIYSFKIEKLTLAESMVEDIPDQTYSGKAIKPAVTLKTGENVIGSGNYSVTYRNNIKAGTATIRITGKGNCQGTIEKTFEILPKSVEDLKVSVANSVYSGKELTPKITVSDEKKKLTVGKDYTVAFENTLHADTDPEDDKNPCVTITGMGNYAGEKKIFFTILPYTTSAKQVAVSLYRNQTGNGSLDVTVNKQAVTAGTDYTAVITEQETGAEVLCSELKAGSKYTITLSFMGNYTSKEPVEIRNVVCRTDLTDFTVKFVVNGEKTDEISPLVYSGKAKKPAVSVMAGDEVLSSGYYTVSYKNNINAGTATVTVTGKGNFAGSISREFTIAPKNLDSTVVISAIKDMTYTGKEIKPSVTIKGLKMGEGKDYRISGYENNINVNHEGDELPTVIVTLSGNYRMDGKQTFTRTFHIKPAKITSVKVAKAYYQAGAEVKPALTVKAGKLILEESDYNAVWSNHVDVGKASVEVTADAATGNFYTIKPVKVNFNIVRESLSGAKAVQIGNPIYTGEPIDFHDFFILYDREGKVIAEDQYEVTPDDRVNAGTVSVTFKAKSGAGTRFTGKKTVKCKIATAFIGDYLIRTETGLPDKIYNKGKALTFTSRELNAAFRDKVSGKAISTSSFTVKYVDNREEGRGKLYITGKGNYNGTTVVYFTIRK